MATKGTGKWSVTVGLCDYASNGWTPRWLLSVTLPSQILYQDGFSDAGGIPARFDQGLRDYFTVIGGNTDNAAIINGLRAEGKVFLHSVGYNSSFTAQQLVDMWSTPFNDTLAGNLPGGFDGIEIDEILGWGNGSTESNRIISALQMLRQQYPDKIIATFTAPPFGTNPAAHSNLLGAVNDYADLNLFEAYLWEQQSPAYFVVSQWAANMNAVEPGILNKTIFALFSAQSGHPGDDSTSVGFWGHLDEQMHTIRNDPIASQMPGVGSYVYGLRLTSEFMGRAMDHYYVQGNTDYFGDGDFTQDITNPQFENTTAGWDLSGPSIGIFNYGSEGVSNTHASFGISSHGNFGLKTVRGASANEAAYDITLEAGKTYNVSAFVSVGSGSSVLDAKLKVVTESGLVISDVMGREIQEPAGALLPWRRLTFNFDALPLQDHVTIILSDEATSPGTTLYWDYIEFEDAYTIGEATPDWQHVQVFLSPSDSTPIVANPQLNLNLGQTKSLYAWVIPDDDIIVSIGLDFESTDLSITQANTHEVFNPYFALADRSRWDFADGGQLGELAFNSSEVAFQDGTGINQGLGAAGAPLYDPTTGAFLHSRIDIQANREGQTEILIKLNNGRIRWSLTEEILGSVQFGAVDVEVLASTVGATGSVADAFINVDSVGDIDGSGTVDGLDIDKLRNDIALQTTDPSQDLNNDSLVNDSDVNYLLTDILQTSISDVNLDRVVDALDLGIVRDNMGLSTPAGFMPWSQGNIVGDGAIDDIDLLSLRFNFGYVSPAGPVQSVPAVASAPPPRGPVDPTLAVPASGLPAQLRVGTAVAPPSEVAPADTGVVFPDAGLQQLNLVYTLPENSIQL